MGSEMIKELGKVVELGEELYVLHKIKLEHTNNMPHFSCYTPCDCG